MKTAALFKPTKIAKCSQNSLKEIFDSSTSHRHKKYISETKSDRAASKFVQKDSSTSRIHDKRPMYIPQPKPEKKVKALYRNHSLHISSGENMLSERDSGRNLKVKVRRNSANDPKASGTANNTSMPQIFNQTPAYSDKRFPSQRRSSSNIVHNQKAKKPFTIAGNKPTIAYTRQNSIASLEKSTLDRVSSRGKIKDNTSLEVQRDMEIAGKKVSSKRNTNQTSNSAVDSTAFKKTKDISQSKHDPQLSKYPEKAGQNGINSNPLNEQPSLELTKFEWLTFIHEFYQKQQREKTVDSNVKLSQEGLQIKIKFSELISHLNCMSKLASKQPQHKKVANLGQRVQKGDLITFIKKVIKSDFNVISSSNMSSKDKQPEFSDKTFKYEKCKLSFHDIGKILFSRDSICCKKIEITKKSVQCSKDSLKDKQMQDKLTEDRNSQSYPEHRQGRSIENQEQVKFSQERNEKSENVIKKKKNISHNHSRSSSLNQNEDEAIETARFHEDYQYSPNLFPESDKNFRGEKDSLARKSQKRNQNSSQNSLCKQEDQKSNDIYLEAVGNIIQKKLKSSEKKQALAYHTSVTSNKNSNRGSTNKIIVQQQNPLSQSIEATNSKALNCSSIGFMDSSIKKPAFSDVSNCKEENHNYLLHNTEQNSGNMNTSDQALLNSSIKNSQQPCLIGDSIEIPIQSLNMLNSTKQLFIDSVILSNFCHSNINVSFSEEPLENDTISLGTNNYHNEEESKDLSALTFEEILQQVESIQKSMQVYCATASANVITGVSTAAELSSAASASGLSKVEDFNEVNDFLSQLVDYKMYRRDKSAIRKDDGILSSYFNALKLNCINPSSEKSEKSILKMVDSGLLREYLAHIEAIKFNKSPLLNAHLLRFLSNNTNIKILNISSNQLQTLNPIREILKQNKGLEFINLSNNELNSIELLFDLIFDQPYPQREALNSLKELHLKNNCIEKIGFMQKQVICSSRHNEKALCSKVLSQLQILDLRQNRLDRWQKSEILSIISNCENLSILALKGNPILDVTSSDSQEISEKMTENCLYQYESLQVANLQMMSQYIKYKEITFEDSNEFCCSMAADEQQQEQKTEQHTTTYLPNFQISDRQKKQPLQESTNRNIGSMTYEDSILQNGLQPSKNQNHTQNQQILVEKLKKENQRHSEGNSAQSSKRKIKAIKSKIEPHQR